VNDGNEIKNCKVCSFAFVTFFPPNTGCELSIWLPTTSSAARTVARRLALPIGKRQEAFLRPP
jgi:hypothetical protein